MANATRSESTPVTQGPAPPHGSPTEPPQPVLFDDMQPVYLARLYPDIVNKELGPARDAAMDAGRAARAAGIKLVAAQNEPAEPPAPDAKPAPAHPPEQKPDAARASH